MNNINPKPIEENTERTDAPTGRSRRGFASMDPELRREIARQGGRAAHASGHAHEFTPEEAREMGRRGGRARWQKHQMMKNQQANPGLEHKGPEETPVSSIEGGVNYGDAPTNDPRAVRLPERPVRAPGEQTDQKVKNESTIDRSSNQDRDQDEDDRDFRRVG